MTDSARKLSVEEAEEPLLAFRAFKGMPYQRRMRLVLIFALLGVCLQVASLSFLAGLPFLLAATILSWVVGFDSAVDRRGQTMQVAWQTVPFQEIEQIVALDRKMKKWDRGWFDISNANGCFLFFAQAAMAFTLGIFLPGPRFIIWGDAAVLFLLQWFSGMRRVDRRPDLILKANHLLKVVASMKEEIEQYGELKGMLLLEGEGEDHQPTDVKIQIRPKDAPNFYYGVQSQVCLNRVQGKPYPYCYSVVIAKEDHGLLGASIGYRVGGADVETSVKKGVEVVIVRQHTTKTSGYHTKPSASLRMLKGALDLGRKYLDSSDTKAA